MLGLLLEFRLCLKIRRRLIANQQPGPEIQRRVLSLLRDGCKEFLRRNPWIVLNQVPQVLFRDDVLGHLSLPNRIEPHLGLDEQRLIGDDHGALHRRSHVD